MHPVAPFSFHLFFSWLKKAKGTNNIEQNNIDYYISHFTNVVEHENETEIFLLCITFFVVSWFFLVFGGFGQGWKDCEINITAILIV